MKLSMIVKKHATADGRTFYGATARGKYLTGVKGITEGEHEEMFVVKIVAGSGAFPADEGVFEVVLDGDAWLDRREGVKCGSLRVVRIKGACTFTKKAEFVEQPKKAETSEVAF